MIAPGALGLLSQGRRFLFDIAAFARWRGVLAIGLVLAAAVSEGVGILLLVPLLASLMQDAQGSAGLANDAALLLAYLPGDGPEGKLAWGVALFVCAVLARSLLQFLRDMTLAGLQVGFVQSRRLATVRALGSCEWSAVNRLQHARMTQVLTTELDRCGTAANCLLQLLVAAILLLAHLGVALLLSAQLALFTLLLLATSVAIVGRFLRRAGEAGQLLVITNRRLISDTGRYVGGLKQAIGESRQASFVALSEKTLGVMGQTHIGLFRQQSATRVVTGIVGAVVAGGALLIGYLYLDVAAPVLIAFLVLLSRLTGPATQLQQSMLQLSANLPANESVRSLLVELGSSVPLAEPPTPLCEAHGSFDIRFEGVRFAYQAGEGEAPPEIVLDQIDLEIPEGEFVGIFGPSGAGKTTVADLVAFLQSPHSGSVLVGGTSLNRATAPGWRRRLAYVDQDPFFFHGTVAENLFWERDGGSDEAVWNALQSMGADRLVRSLPEELDALVGERGALLSGGQRQRLAIARAILRQPDVLILDEATNAMDEASQDRALQSVRRALPGATIILISHSRAATSHCDRILTLKDGRIVSGSV